MTKDSKDDRPEGSYEDVGYCKPPKKNRFRKGKSGNPKGRPKRAKGLKSDLKEELASRITVKIAGKEHTGTKQRLMLNAITLRAATGDTRAAEKLFNLILAVLGVEDEDAQSERLSKRDEALLEQFLSYVGVGSDEVENPDG